MNNHNTMLSYAAVADLIRDTLKHIRATCKRRENKHEHAVAREHKRDQQIIYILPIGVQELSR
jgi:hypothetical protein